MATNAKIAPKPILEHTGPLIQEFEAEFQIPISQKLEPEVTQELWDNYSDNLRFKKGNTTLRIERIPIGEGQTSYAFKIHDKTRNMNLIGKIDKEVYDGLSS